MPLRRKRSPLMESRESPAQAGFARAQVVVIRWLGAPKPPALRALRSDIVTAFNDEAPRSP